MRTFLVKAFLFAILLKGIDLALFQTLSWVDRIGPAEAPGLRAMYSGKIDADIVVFGSSRANMQVDPATLERATGLRAYNLAMLGADFNQHFFTLKEYVDFHGPPRAAVFEADMESLDEYWELGFRKEFFRPYIHRSKRAFGLFGDTFAHALAYKTFQSLVFRNRLLKVIGKLWIPVEKEKGVTFVRGARLREGRDPNWKTEATWKWPLHDTSERHKKFEELARWADEHGFPLVLLAMPRYKQENQIRPELRSAALAFYGGLVVRHANLYFADFSNDERLNTELEYYWDRVHLNAKGARRFSEILGAELAGLIAGREQSAPESAKTAKNF